MRTRLEVLTNGGWTPFRQPKHYCWDGPRLLAGGTHSLDLFVELACPEKVDAEIVLHLHPEEGKTVTKRKRITSRSEARECLLKVSEFVQSDSRAELEIVHAGVRSGFDEHDVMWFETPSLDLLRLLISVGYVEGGLEVPMPHRHTHWPEYDRFLA